jgi:O-antigen ligase
MSRTHSSTEHETSRIAKVIVVLLCAIPLIAIVAYGAVDSWTIGMLSILVAVIALLWLADAGLGGEFRYSSNPVQLPIICLLAIGCVQLLPFGSGDAGSLLNAPAVNTLSMDPYATRFFLIRLLICFVFFAAALVYLPGGKRHRRIAVTIVTFGTLVAFFAILQRLIAVPEAIYGLRPTAQAIPLGPFVNQHHFAALMEMTSGLVLGLLFGGGSSRERKIILALAAGIMGMAIMFTGSRGGLISYLGVVVLAAVASFTWGAEAVAREDQDSRSRSRRNLLIMTSAGGLVLLVLGSVLFLGGESSVLRGIGLQNVPSDVTSGRAHFWSIAWKIFLAHPILGAGFDAFGVAFPRYDSWNGQFRVEQAHNDYLQTLADGGIVSLACVLAFVFIFVRQGIVSISRRTSEINRSISTGALAGCFGILIHSFFDFPLRTPANAFFFLLLVVLAIGNGAAAKRSRQA